MKKIEKKLKKKCPKVNVEMISNEIRSQEQFSK